VQYIRNLKVGSIEQNQIATDHNVRIVRRRRRQFPFQVGRAGLHLLLKSWRQRSTNHELALQSRWKAVALGQTWWEMPVVSTVPTAGRLTIVIGIAIVVVAASMTISMASIIVVIAIVFLVAVTISLSDSDCGREGQRQNRSDSHSKPALV